MFSKIKEFIKYINKNKKCYYLVFESLYNTQFKPHGIIIGEEHAKKYCEEHNEQHKKYKYEKIKELRNK